MKKTNKTKKASAKTPPKMMMKMDKKMSGKKPC